MNLAPSLRCLTLLAALHVGGCSGDPAPAPADAPISDAQDASGDRSDGDSTAPDVPLSPDAPTVDTPGDVTPDAPRCAAPEVVCAGGCVDTRSDSAHCGACETPCGLGASCSAGRCVCAAGRALCGTQCVDLQTSGAHCGACEVACTMGQVCGAGRCACLPGRVLCAGTGCTGLSFDPTNCGACGTRCVAPQRCVEGACT